MDDKPLKFLKGSRQEPEKGETPIGRFFQKINQFLKREEVPAVDLKLQGRIIELQANAEKILLDLLAVKVSLEQAFEPNIFAHICTIIDPIIREIAHIDKALNYHEGTTHQVKTVYRYIEWIDKAKIWIDIASIKSSSKELLSEAVINHSIQEFHTRLDRDIQVITDYLNNSINQSSLVEALKDSIRKNILPEVSKYINELLSLKNASERLSIDTLPQWRAKADREREKAFGAALHVIDVAISEQAPEAANDPVSEHHMDILIQLSAIEKEISELSEQVESLTEENVQMKKICLEALSRLEVQSHDLNGNLRLSPDQEDRVQNAINILSALRQGLL